MQVSERRRESWDAASSGAPSPVIKAKSPPLPPSPSSLAPKTGALGPTSPDGDGAALPAAGEGVALADLKVEIRK